MKIAAAVTNNQGLDSQIDARFGRTQGFLTVDTQGNIAYLENTQNLNAVQGAGIQAAQNVLESAPDAVLTGHCGPKAFRVLQAANVKVYLAKNITVAQAINQIQTGELTPADNADVQGHWQ